VTLTGRAHDLTGDDVLLLMLTVSEGVDEDLYIVE
jgi:hypothetical protein